jgi:alkylation response protein AidB-like acyl-CoA dehydrogenase
MHFLPTPDQLDLQRGVRDVLDSAFPLDRLEEGWNSSRWQALQDIGVFSLRTELGLGLVEAALVFEELGRACVPGPLVASFLLAAEHAGPSTVLDADAHPLLVAHLDASATLLVLNADASYVVSTTDVAGEPVAQPLDPLTPLTQLPEAPTGTAYGDTTLLRREGALLTAALQVGLAARMTELAVDYAGRREQFGQVIGSFQAVKHICGDMFVRTELARVAVHAAAATLDDLGFGDAARTVAGANARACVQVHGGMGFTWEVPVHFFVKRAWVHATEFGTADEHAETVADCLVGAT